MAGVVRGDHAGTIGSARPRVELSASWLRMFHP
jgi:hypothetical protein